MTGFAERLIARSAGRPTGLPLLKPRPAARFEQEMRPPIDTEPSVEPVREASLPDASRRASSATARAESAIPPSVPDKPLVPDAAIKTERGVQPLTPQQSAYPAEPPHAETPSSRISDPQEVKSVPASEHAAPRDRSGSQAEFRPRSLFFDEPLVQPVTRPAPQAERASPAPAISIGRIDVQFLPQERPVAPTPPKPQRTRGFDGYARARRGEPR